MTLTATLAKDAPDGAVPALGVTIDAFAEHPLHDYLDGVGFAAKSGEHRVVPDADGRSTIVVGLGADADRTVDDFRLVGGAIARAAKKHVAVHTDVLSQAGALDPAAVAQALAEGLGLGQYAYTVLKSDPTPSVLEVVHVVGKGGKRVQQALELGTAVADAVAVARDLVNEPGGTLTAYSDNAAVLSGHP